MARTLCAEGVNQQWLHAHSHEHYGNGPLHSMTCNAAATGWHPLLCSARAQLRVDTPVIFTLSLNWIGVYYLDDFSWEYDSLDMAYMSDSSVGSRVAAHRKGNFTLHFLDASNATLPAGALAGANVTMKRHDWAFGTMYEQLSVGGWVGSGGRLRGGAVGPGLLGGRRALGVSHAASLSGARRIPACYRQG